MAESVPVQENVRNYLNAFFDILNEVRGTTNWMDFLNLRTFYAEADLYAQTAARYSYEDLEQQLRVEQATEEEGGLLVRMYSDIHPALGGPRKYVKDRKDLVTALRSVAEDIKRLPQSLRTTLRKFVNGCYGRLRRFIGAKQFTWLKSMCVFSYESF